MKNELLESLASLSEEQIKLVLSQLSPQEKAELDRLLAAPGPVDVTTPQPWFHEAQHALWVASSKVVAFVAGTQSGKTVCAPWLTLREIKRKFKNGQPNEHLVASPTFKLMDKKLLPEYKRILCEKLSLGEYIAGDVCIKLSDEGIYRITGQKPATGTSVLIWFGHAGNPDSLESATYMSAVLDEAGQDSFRAGSYEAVIRRLSINEGTCYILTTPYNRNWFFERIYRKGVVTTFKETDNGFIVVHDGAGNSDTGITVITCPSIMNPEFPRSEWEFAKSTLADWQFEMMYMGKFTLPAGVIFDSFTDENIVPRMPIPNHWPVFMGVDFGLINTAACMVAEEWERGEPTGRYFIFGTYLPKDEAGKPIARTARQHIKEIHKMCPRKRPIGYGGSHAESGWRESWAQAGLPLFEPTFNSLWPQINTIWTAFDQKVLLVFDDLSEMIEELRSMSRELDDDDVPIQDRIKDEKKYHRIAALRYIGTRIFRNLYRKLLKGELRTDTNSPPL